MYWITEAEDDELLGGEAAFPMGKDAIDRWIEEYIYLKVFEGNVQRHYDDIVHNPETFASFDADGYTTQVLEFSSSGHNMAKYIFENFGLINYININKEDLPLDEEGGIDTENENYIDLTEDIEYFMEKVFDRVQERITINTVPEAEDWYLSVGYFEGDGSYGVNLYISQIEGVEEEE